MGLRIDYFYKLTQRQFYNAVNGYRKKEDYLSRERWQIGRKVMFAYMCKYLGENGKETDVLQFPWEDNLIKKLSEQEEIEFVEAHEASELFWENWDKRKRGKA